MKIYLYGKWFNQIQFINDTKKISQVVHFNLISKYKKYNNRNIYLFPAITNEEVFASVESDIYKRMACSKGASFTGNFTCNSLRQAKNFDTFFSILIKSGIQKNIIGVGKNTLAYFDDTIRRKKMFTNQYNKSIFKKLKESALMAAYFDSEYMALVLFFIYKLFESFLITGIEIINLDKLGILFDSNYAFSVN
ncbi:unnamed protein product [marine sediment metagenome]|uniref:Uncharacterized protein n=1 Tax=marine sediment metagenome TaxID=412755 RepID=X1IL02_9ZZZZ